MSDKKVKYTNRELAKIFESIADLLEIKGEVVYKTLAYRKASDSLNNLARDINDIWRDGELTNIPGVGKAIAEKIDELLSTGKLEFLESGGPSLNIIKNAQYISSSIELFPGDQIIFYTDGVTEIFNRDLMEFGFERLKEVILKSKNMSACAIIDNIVESTKNFSRSKLYRDDFTLIVLRRK